MKSRMGPRYAGMAVASNVDRLAYFLDTKSRTAGDTYRHASTRGLALGLLASAIIHGGIAVSGLLDKLNVATPASRSTAFAARLNQAPPGTELGKKLNEPKPTETHWGPAAKAAPPPVFKVADNKKAKAAKKSAAAQADQPPAQSSLTEEQTSSKVSLSHLIGETLIYPLEAVKQGLEGMVILDVTLDASGSVSAAKVLDTSGHAILDDAAVAAAMRVFKMPEWANTSEILPVVFKLEP